MDESIFVIIRQTTSALSVINAEWRSDFLSKIQLSLLLQINNLDNM